MLGRRRGAVLLEVVVSIGILLMSMAVVGLVFRNGQLSIHRAERITRAMLLTEQLLVELDTNILELDEQELVGSFEVEAENGMAYRIEINPDINHEGLLRVDLDIFLGDPDGADGERVRILSTHVFRPLPMGLDFERDFGFDQEQIDQLTDAIPGGVAVLDPTNFDPRDLAGLDLDTLVEILPALMEALGLSLGSAQLTQMMQAASQGDIGSLQAMGQAAGVNTNAGALQPGGGGLGGRAGDNRGGGQGRRPGAGRGEGGERGQGGFGQGGGGRGQGAGGRGQGGGGRGQGAGGRGQGGGGRGQGGGFGQRGGGGGGGQGGQGARRPGGRRGAGGANGGDDRRGGGGGGRRGTGGGNRGGGGGRGG